MHNERRLMLPRRTWMLARTWPWIFFLTSCQSQVPVLQEMNNLWVRNGQLLKARPGLPPIPADSNLWDQRTSLYDIYGNYRLAPNYTADISSNAPQVISKSQFTPPTNNINGNVEASFWFGQSLSDGNYAWSVPGKPWIRQSLPYTCSDNPFQECSGTQCASSTCPRGRQVGSPTFLPNGGNFEGNVLVRIEVEGTRMMSSKLASAGVIPITGFQNGLCKRACEGKLTYPTCNNQLSPFSGVYGTQLIAGYYRPSSLQNPCKSDHHHLVKSGYECRCNVDRLYCNSDAYCQIETSQCTDYTGRKCSSNEQFNLDNQTCGPLEYGGYCAFGTWAEGQDCIDDLTPVWPDSDFQTVTAASPQRVSSDCRNVVCSDNTQCIHVYYTLDGSTPTRNSRLYHGPFILDLNLPITSNVVADLPFAFVTIKAIAVQEGNLDSPIAISKTFYIKRTVVSTGIGRAWSWGYNTRGQLGLGDGLYGGDPRFPNDIPGAPGLLMPSFCFDTATQQLIPNLNCDPSLWVYTSPQPNMFNADLLNPANPMITYFAAGAYHNVIVTAMGKIMAWGWNGYGQLGTYINQPTYGLPTHPSDSTQRNLPTAVHFNDANLASKMFVYASAGTFHSAAMDTDGNVYTWGNNYEGQLCSGDLKNVDFPNPINVKPTDDNGNAIPGARWVQIELGSEHTILLANTGEVYACGSNRMYQLGRPRFHPDIIVGTQSSCPTDKTPEGCPTQFNIRWMRPIRVLGGWSCVDLVCNGPPLQRVVKISAGSYHSVALTADGKIFAWGDNRMNQLGLGPLVEKANPCCAVQVPFYIDNARANLQPQPNPPSFPWQGYKALDVAAGSHFNIAIIVNVTGEGCTGDGVRSGYQCFSQDPVNGLVLQDWDIPRDIDIVGDHLRTNQFNFSLAISCDCQGSFHLPGGLANCDQGLYVEVQELSNGYCYYPRSNSSSPCRYKQTGTCPDGSPCAGPMDCGMQPCYRVIHTCSSSCPCADRSCPARVGDQMPKPGETVTLLDSWFRRAVKKQETCGCTPGYATESCTNWLTLGVKGALPDCCLNTKAGAPVPPVKMNKQQWDNFNLNAGLPQGVYGTCPPGTECINADPRGCAADNCRFADEATLGEPDDGHPLYTLGNRQTCMCYKPGVCIGGAQPMKSCTLQTGNVDCIGNPPGYCSSGGGMYWPDGASSPVFWGDCTCRNATKSEWEQRYRGPGSFRSCSQVQNASTNCQEGVSLSLTFWNSNVCPYHNKKQWSGADCRLVKIPLPKFVFGWGDTRAGQLGKSLISSPPLAPPNDQPPNFPRPVEIPSLSRLDLLSISAGDYHAGALVDARIYDSRVCNLTYADPNSWAVPPELGGMGRDMLGIPFRCDGRLVYTWGSNTEGELGLGYITPSQAIDCISAGNVHIPCENMGGSLTAQLVTSLVGKNVSQLSLGFKHSAALLGSCPASSKDRCEICFGINRECVGCSGITNDPTVDDWCGVCAGDNSSCTGCLASFDCQQSSPCRDKQGANVSCVSSEGYHPCHQGRKKGVPCCLDLTGKPATPFNANPQDQKNGRSAGAGPIPCSSFGVDSWRDRTRASSNFCGLLYDECDVCDGDHTRCLDCMGVNQGKIDDDYCHVCGGLATSCVGCDGRPEPNEKLRTKYDACEMCNGTNSTCSLVLLVFNGTDRLFPSSYLLALLLGSILWILADEGR
uniref:RCC1-like domain-containing protein n=1 Tax=Guillardia theta TaxID=55529 RepID=A0A7S4PFN2_GUITH|mmetsp:Transcript_50020/g.156550  ORF Transcript_50020/g.156550 Transcript_50020/m.156550 type:complete len:1681 (+) Transcript_50020:153-5195(+)